MAGITKRMFVLGLGYVLHKTKSFELNSYRLQISSEKHYLHTGINVTFYLFIIFVGPSASEKCSFLLSRVSDTFNVFLQLSFYHIYQKWWNERFHSNL